MNLIKYILKETQKKTVIDNKQQFVGFKKKYLEKKYLYEFNLKTKNGFQSEEHFDFLEKLTLFDESDDVGYQVHYTSIPDTFITDKDSFKGWSIFKLTIALDKKKALNVLKSYLTRNIRDSRVKVLASRIVLNKEKVDCDQYFAALTAHLISLYPYVYPKNRIMLIYQKKSES